jgi:hypothetical protein
VVVTSPIPATIAFERILIPTDSPILLLALVVILIASHALVLRFALQHKSLSASVVTGVIILVVMTHLGLLSRLYALFRRRSRQ